MPTPEIEIIEQDGQFQVVRSVPVTTYETTVVGTFADRAMADLMADTLRAPVAPAATKLKGTRASAAEKRRAVMMVRQGMSYADVGRAIGRSDQAVRDWCIGAGVS